MRKLLFFLMVPALSWGQDSTLADTKPVVDYLEKSVWRVLFLTPGITNEYQWGQTITIVSDVRLSGSWLAVGGSRNQTRINSSYYLNADVSLGVRHFYNFERRLIKGKSIRYNSANYLMLKAGYLLPPFVEYQDPTIHLRVRQGPSVSFLWGFQRTYRRNFYLNLALGLQTSTYSTGITSDFVLGYTFPNKKAKTVTPVYGLP